MDIEELVAHCIDDRFRFMREQKLTIPKSKKYNLDLVVKFAYLMLNSFGKKNRKPEVLFVDEVNNRSMINNLRDTMANCDRSYALMMFRGIERERHVRIGFFRPIWLLLSVLMAHVVFYIEIPFCKWEKVNQRSTRNLIKHFIRYLDAMETTGSDRIKAFCMTDHNFYSHVVCSDKRMESSVLQHGLVLDVSYYYPVYADHFLAWGKRSFDAMPQTDKVRITGTYKFSQLKPLPEETGTQKSILYCVSSVDTQKVQNKIEDLLRITEGTNYKLKVKMHPGSFFSTADLEQKYGPDKLELFKECSVSDISFSVAVIENSTVLLDLLYLKKPFVIYDGVNGYFGHYGSMIPWAENAENLAELLHRYETIDYDKIRELLISEELNADTVNIF